MKEDTKALIELFMEVENKQYPGFYRRESKQCVQLAERTERVIRLIDELSWNRATINTYTNMMQSMHSLTVDTFDSKRYTFGSIVIDVGSEPQELQAVRIKDGTITARFNFDDWTFEPVKESK